MFEYKRPISSVIDGPRFTVAQIGNIYCIVAGVGNFYKVYGAERLNTLGRSKEDANIESITSLGRYVVTVSGRTVSIYNQGHKIQHIEIAEEIEDLLAYDEYIVVKTDRSLLRIDIEGIEGIEDRKIEYKTAELLNQPERIDSMHRLALNNKQMIVSQGQVHIYSAAKDRLIYTLRCVSISGRVVDTSLSISPEIVAIATSKDLYIVQIKKDVLLQHFSFDSIQSVDFRRTVLTKELAVLTEKEVLIICLEQGSVKKRHQLSHNPAVEKQAHKVHTARYIGTDGYLVISQENELCILDCQHSRIVQVKRRAGVVFGKEQATDFLKDRLIVSTNGRIYSLSLRKEEQLRELSRMNAQGQPVSISIVRDTVIACYSKGIHSLKETVGGLTETKRRLGNSTPREYSGAVMSFCGNALAVSIKETESRIRILIASRESGFILGEIEESPYLSLSLNNLEKTLTVMHASCVTVYSYGGSVLSNIHTVKTDEPENTRYKHEIKGKIVETRRHKYYVYVSDRNIQIYSRDGAQIKNIEKCKGAPISIRITQDMAWILVMSQQETGALLEIVEIESATVLSSLSFNYAPKDFAITEDRSKLVVITDKRILLFANTYKIHSTLHRAEEASCKGICFSSAHRSRIRLLLGYESLGEKLEEGAEETAVLAPYAAEKENTPRTNILSHKATAVESIQALIDGNYPISQIVAHIKETEDPSALLNDLTNYLETEYDISDALINRVLYYRRKDLSIEKIKDSIRKREEIAERLITTYLSILSMTSRQ